MAAQYDLMLLLDPNAPEGRDEQILGDVEGAIEAGGSLIGDRHDWATLPVSMRMSPAASARRAVKVPAGWTTSSASSKRVRRRTTTSTA